MTSKAWPSIDRVKKGKRSAGQLKHESQPPHLQVLCSADGDDERLPALASTGSQSVEELLWISHPRKPKKRPVVVYATADAAEPDYVITPGRGGNAPSEVTKPDGKFVLTAEPSGSVFRTSWTIHTPDRHAVFAITERKRDALWRRTFGPPTKSTGGGTDLLGLLVLVFFLPAMFKPPIRMLITDPTGANVGTVTFASAAIRPRQSFCLYLDNQPYPIRDNTLVLAAIAIVQRMR